MSNPKPRRGGTRGRVVPTTIKKSTGTYRKDRANSDEPSFSETLPIAPPAHLDRLGREHWVTYAPMFAKAGTLLESDYAALVVACERWSTYRKAADAMRQPGLDIDDLGKINRLITSTITSWFMIMREYGVGAASRSRVRAEKPPEKDEFEEFEVA